MKALIPLLLLCILNLSKVCWAVSRADEVVKEAEVKEPEFKVFWGDKSPITFGGELEGKSLTIYDYYRPDTVAQGDWVAAKPEQKAILAKGVSFNKFVLTDEGKRNPFLGKLKEEVFAKTWEINFDTNFIGSSFNKLKEGFKALNKNKKLTNDRGLQRAQAHIVFPIPSEQADWEHVVTHAVAAADALLLFDVEHACTHSYNKFMADEDYTALLKSKKDIENNVKDGPGGYDKWKFFTIGFRTPSTYGSTTHMGLEIRHFAPKWKQTECVMTKLITSLTDKTTRPCYISCNEDCQITKTKPKIPCSDKMTVANMKKFYENRKAKGDAVSGACEKFKTSVQLINWGAFPERGETKFVSTLDNLKCLP